MYQNYYYYYYYCCCCYNRYCVNLLQPDKCQTQNNSKLLLALLDKARCSTDNMQQLGSAALATAALPG